MSIDYDALLASAEEAAELGQDFTQTSSGGGDYVPPDAGATRLRLVSYIELGVHTTEFKGAPKTKPRAQVDFELSGPKHAPKELDDGRKIPHRISINETIGDNVKNGIIKLFNALNYDGKYKNFVQMVYKESWRGTVVHRKAKVGDKEMTFAGLRNDSGYQIFSPTFEDPETQELRQIVAAPPITPPRIFLWNNPSLEMWDSLFIEGEYDDGGSKNKIQEKIRSAENFVGSPIYELLKEAGRADDLIIPEKRVRGAKPAQAEEGGEEEAPKVKALVKADPKAAKTLAANPKTTGAKPAKAAAKVKGDERPEPPDDDDPLSGL